MYSHSGERWHPFRARGRSVLLEDPHEPSQLRRPLGQEAGCSAYLNAVTCEVYSFAGGLRSSSSGMLSVSAILPDQLLSRKTGYCCGIRKVSRNARRPIGGAPTALEVRLDQTIVRLGTGSKGTHP